MYLQCIIDWADFSKGTALGKGLKEARAALEKGLKGGTLKGINLKASRRMKLVQKAGKYGAGMVFVSNVRGSAGKKCKCGCPGWNEHWHRKTKRVLKQQKCYVRGCGKPASVGAHVHVEKKGNKQHILPFCSWHNSRSLTVALALKKNSFLKDAVPAYDLLP